MPVDAAREPAPFGAAFVQALSSSPVKPAGLTTLKVKLGRVVAWAAMNSALARTFQPQVQISNG